MCGFSLSSSTISKIRQSPLILVIAESGKTFKYNIYAFIFSTYEGMIE